MKKLNKLLLCASVIPVLFACNNNKKDEDTSKTYTVTLNANGGKFDSTSSETKAITGCTTLAKADLEEPTKDDAGFKGWYFDSGSSNEVTFPYTLSKDINVYAGWSTMPTGVFEHTQTSSITVSDQPVGNVYTVIVNTSTNETPTITLSGCLNNAQLNFEIPKKYTGEVNVILNGFKIVSTDSLAPIVFANKNNCTVNITSNEGTSNFIFDKRPSTGSFDDDGAINSKSNLKFNGAGSLFVNDKSSYQGYSDAIYSSKNITIENTSIKAYGTNNSIKGKRSITINDSNVTIYSKTGLGLKTSDEDVQDNKRCGDISINGNTSLTIATAQHGISAAHVLIINETSNGTPKISVYTSDYASSYTTISTPSPDEEDMYIYIPTSLSSYGNQSNYRFAVLFDGKDWDNARLKKIYSSSQPMLSSKNEGPQPGGGTAGYYFGLDRPKAASTYQIVLFSSTQDENPDTSEEELKPGTPGAEGVNCVAVSNVLSFPSSGDTAKIKTLSGTSITCDTTGFGIYDKMLDKSENPDKASYGCKGLTAGNKLEINAGTISIKAKDDALQSKFGKLFPIDSTAGFPREVGQGILNINGDNTNIYITSADDGMNAVTLNIGTSGCPNINIDTSREGLEASVINYINGNTSLYAKDDGVNGSSNGDKQNSDISVNVSGGYLDVQVADGDTDGIDSNNTFTQTGGIIVSRASSNSDMSTGLDTDSTATISNTGVFIALGARLEAEKEGKLTYNKKTQSSISYSKNSSYIINDKYKFKVTLEYKTMYTYLGGSASAPTIK